MVEVYVGLDVGSRCCHVVAIDKDGKAILDKSFPTSEANLREVFEGLRGEVHVHLESCDLAVWVRRVIKPVVGDVVVSHPKTNRWIAVDPRKNDRLDARKLADLLRLGNVHAVYMTDDEDLLGFKQVVQMYDRLVRQVTRLKIQVKCRLRSQGLIATGEEVYSKLGRVEWLGQVTSTQVREAIRILYQMLDQAEASEKQMTKLLRSMADGRVAVRRLETVPGVGLISACRFVAYVQEPSRFSSREKLWRYCGLAVTHKSSDGQPLTHPRLDRTSGNPRLKNMSRQVFLGAMRTTQENMFQRMYRGAMASSQRSNHARLSVQRKIVAVLRALWKEDKDYMENMGEVR